MPPTPLERPEAFCFEAVRACMRDRILKVCSHDILQTARGNFTPRHSWGQI